MRVKLHLFSNRDIDIFIGNVLALSFFKTVFLQLLHLLFGEENTLVSVLVFGVLLSYFYIGLVNYKLFRQGRVLIWFFVLLFFLLNYVFSKSIFHEYYFSIDMILTYIYFIPIAICLVPKITDVKKVISRISSLRYIVLLIAAYMVFGMNYADNEHETYMSFSYAIMPFVVLCFYEACINKKKIDYFTYIIGVIVIVFYGARTPLTSCIVAALIIYLIYVKANRKYFAFSILVVFCIAILSFGNVLTSRLGSIGESIGSYSLSKLSNDESFTGSSTRVILYERAIKAIEDNNGMPLGLFADRYYVDDIYVHNIFLELIINYGIIVGGFISLWIVFMIFRSFIVSKNEFVRIFLVFCFFSMFVRFIFSGSYLIEGISFVYFSIILKYSRKNVVRSNIAYLQK